MKYNKDFIIGFAEYFKTSDDSVYDAFDIFEVLKEQEKPDPKPEPEQGICLQVLEAAAEMCSVSMDELSNGKKYGDIPTCKQMTAKILHELKCSDETIANELPQMGSVGSIRSRREAAARYEKVEKNYRQVMNQLRSKFGIAIPVVLRH